MKKFNVAIIGCGTVGSYTADILIRDKDQITKRTGIEYNLKYIFAKDFQKGIELGITSDYFAQSFDTIINDKEIDLVVELVGGTTFAFDYSVQVLKAGKNLVTANKALLAKKGAELFKIARDNGVSVAFEASCGGGIPIVRALYDGLIANENRAIYGIVNGTCNFILSEMIDKGKKYDEVLKQAQADGLAEADPTLDVSGHDSAHKLAILSSLAYGKSVGVQEFPVTGINNLNLIDLKFGQELGYTIKLLAISEKREDGLSLRVRPAFISKDHPLAWVSGSFNAVSVYGSRVGHTMYYGRGAGGNPTASAVVSDIVSIGLGDSRFGQLKIWPDLTEAATLLPEERIEERYYLRVMVDNVPGVFAKIGKIMENESISISSVLQKESRNPDIIPVVITTERTTQGNINKALESLKSTKEIHDTYCISIVDEHKEWM
ncbi:MAG: homoserine dehydrogenase [Spirochaetales bacterium]|nr:homoserine dehydrogenase [Spirochaetales bacterium]